MEGVIVKKYYLETNERARGKRGKGGSDTIGFLDLAKSRLWSLPQNWIKRADMYEREGERKGRERKGEGGRGRERNGGRGGRKEEGWDLWIR